MLTNTATSTSSNNCSCTANHKRRQFYGSPKFVVLPTVWPQHLFPNLTSLAFALTTLPIISTAASTATCLTLHSYPHSLSRINDVHIFSFPNRRELLSLGAPLRHLYHCCENHCENQKISVTNIVSITIPSASPLSPLLC